MDILQFCNLLHICLRSLQGSYCLWRGSFMELIRRYMVGRILLNNRVILLFRRQEYLPCLLVLLDRRLLLLWFHHILIQEGQAFSLHKVILLYRRIWLGRLFIPHTLFHKGHNRCQCSRRDRCGRMVVLKVMVIHHCCRLRPKCIQWLYLGIISLFLFILLSQGRDLGFH